MIYSLLCESFSLLFSVMHPFPENDAVVILQFSQLTPLEYLGAKLLFLQCCLYVYLENQTLLKCGLDMFSHRFLFCHMYNYFVLFLVFFTPCLLWFPCFTNRNCTCMLSKGLAGTYRQGVLLHCTAVLQVLSPKWQVPLFQI